MINYSYNYLLLQQNVVAQQLQQAPMQSGMPKAPEYNAIKINIENPQVQAPGYSPYNMPYNSIYSYPQAQQVQQAATPVINQDIQNVAPVDTQPKEIEKTEVQPVKVPEPQVAELPLNTQSPKVEDAPKQPEKVKEEVAPVQAQETKSESPKDIDKDKDKEQAKA